MRRQTSKVADCCKHVRSRTSLEAPKMNQTNDLIKYKTDKVKTFKEFLKTLNLKCNSSV